MSTLTPANFTNAYAAMIAGAVPLHSGDVDRTVFMVAQDVLGTARMHVLVATDAASQMVYYLATPSAALSSIPGFATPLAAALPAHPQHRGDGIYLLQDVNLSVAVEKTADQFRLLANSNDVMGDWLAERPQVPVHRVEDDQAWTMESVPGAYRRLADGISLRSAKGSAAVGSIALLIYLTTSIGVSVQNAVADKSNQAHMSAVNEAVTRIEFISPLSQQVARLQRVSALVVRAGGWIDEYEVRNGTEKFVLMMPAWITRDYIDALGPKVEADQSPDENLVRISLGMPLPGTMPVPRASAARRTDPTPAAGSNSMPAAAAAPSVQRSR